MVSAFGVRAHPILSLCSLLLCFSHPCFDFYPALAETTSTRPTHTQMLLCSCFVALPLFCFTDPLSPKAVLEWYGPHTRDSTQPRQLHSREKPSHILYLIIQTESFQRGQLIKVYRRINRTGKRGQDLLFSLSN